MFRAKLFTLFGHGLCPGMRYTTTETRLQEKRYLVYWYPRTDPGHAYRTVRTLRKSLETKTHHFSIRFQSLVWTVENAPKTLL